MPSRERLEEGGWWSLASKEAKEAPEAVLEAADTRLLLGDDDLREGKKGTLTEGKKYDIE